MSECKIQLRLTIVGFLLITLGTQQYASAATASNVALRKPATQTDTAGWAGPDLAVDGDVSTCSATASAASEWTLDLQDYYIIEEVSIHVGLETVSQWVTSAVASPDGQWPERITGPNGGGNYWGKWIEVEFAKNVTVSAVDIYEWIAVSYNRMGIGIIKCYVDVGWVTVWSATSNSFPDGQRMFSPNLMNPCFSNRLRLELIDSTGGYILDIDAVNLHGNATVAKSYKIEMGMTQGKTEAESYMSPSTYSPATWSPADKGPYRHVRLQANPQNESLKVCEVQIKGYPQPRTPHFRAITSITMSNPPVSTVFRVFSNSECATFCLRQTEPACVTAQFDKAKQSCALFIGFDHTHDPSNANITLVFQFAAHFFEN